MPTLTQIYTASYPLVVADARKPHDQWCENSAMKLLEKHGFIKRRSLGATIDVPLDYQINSEATFQASETTAVGDLTAKTSVLTTAQYAIAEVVAPVKWTYKDEATNPSVNQKLDLVKSLITNGLNSHDNKIEAALFTTTTNGFLGFLTLMPEDGQGTVGGIDSGSDAFWRSKFGTNYQADGSDLEAILTAVWNSCMKGTGGKAPKLLLSGSEPHALYEGSLTTQQRYVDSQDLKGGAISLAFKTASWGFSPHGDDHVFFLEPDSYELILSKEYNRHKGEVAELDARTMFQSKIYSALQSIAKNRSRIGVAFKV